MEPCHISRAHSGQALRRGGTPLRSDGSDQAAQPRLLWWAALLTACLLPLGCGGGEACTPGASQACTCTDGSAGAQRCDDDGAGFAACICSSGANNGDASATDSGAETDSQHVDAGPTDTPSDAELAACDCSLNKAQCGFLPKCTIPCGACPTTKQCISNQCILKTPVKTTPFGGACGPNKNCFYPGSSAAQSKKDAYFDCLNAQCKSNRCRNGVCIKTCLISKDAVTNGSGTPGADGIEDPNRTSQCDDAVDGPYGDKWRCVEFRTPAQAQGGSSSGYCYPGHSWKLCKGDSACSAGNSCQIRYVFGKYGTYCVPKRKPIAGKKHVGLGGSCNTDKYFGEVKMCASNWCSSSWGCRAFCADNNDCVTEPGACKAGKCSNQPGNSAEKTCKIDADCSAMFCKSGLTYYSNLDQTFSMCFPKTCELTSDCGEGYGCKLNWNGVASADGDPDPKDPKKVVLPGWNHLCLPHTAGGVKAGQLCDVYPDDSNSDDPLCENSSFCRDGFCGNLCKGDKDCAANMKCGATEFGFDGDKDGWYDYRLVFDHCVGLPNGSTACVANAGCSDKQVCKPWVHKTGNILVGTGVNKVPVKDEYTSSGLCIDKIPGRAQFASYCGTDKDGVQCQTGICLKVFTGQDYGICTDACDSRSDCPAKVKIGSFTYKTICSSRYVMSNQTLLDPTDDVYNPVCWPTSDKNSLDDCSKTRSCALKGEACFPRVITRGPDTAAKVEYWCMAVNGSADPVPNLQAGAACDPKAKVNPCLGGYCLADATAGKGYCSRLCLKDLDCGSNVGKDGLFCNLKRQQIPRKDKAKAAFVPRCEKAKSCIACSNSYDCAGGRLCTNVGGTGKLRDRRCAPSCGSDSDCATATSTDKAVKPTCVERRDRFGKTTGQKVCALSCG